MHSYRDALAELLLLSGPGDWAGLSFFRDGAAARVVGEVDKRAEAARRADREICPRPADVFAALRHTPREKVRAVILGQDPYPNPLNAHGLAFSVPKGRPVPASLRTVYRALQRDLGIMRPRGGTLTAWADRGVLLLNAALTVEEGRPMSHAGLGWITLVAEILAALSQGERSIVFFSWGGFAQKLTAGVDRHRHLVLESRHPSPMGLKAGETGDNHPFIVSAPFRRAKEWWQQQGLEAVDFSLG
jgi:uracil-DNA glycosylase